MELAEHDKSPVPTEHSKNVERSKGAGAIAYPAIDVITTNAKKKFVQKYSSEQILFNLHVNLIFDNIR